MQLTSAQFNSAVLGTEGAARTAEVHEEVALYPEVSDRMSAQAMPKRRTRQSLGDVREETER